MRIGKILVDSDSETHEAHVVFAKFPNDIASRSSSYKNKIILLISFFSVSYFFTFLNTKQ